MLIKRQKNVLKTLLTSSASCWPNTVISFSMRRGEQSKWPNVGSSTASNRHSQITTPALIFWWKERSGQVQVNKLTGDKLCSTVISWEWEVGMSHWTPRGCRLRRHCLAWPGAQFMTFPPLPLLLIAPQFGFCPQPIRSLTWNRCREGGYLEFWIMIRRGNLGN